MYTFIARFVKDIVDSSRRVAEAEEKQESGNSPGLINNQSGVQMEFS
jgi:hypothetical protein